MADVGELFDDLRRVNIVDKTKVGGWSLDEITTLIADQMIAKNSCLVIVNTKTWARQLFESCQPNISKATRIYHLSTAQCPAHRKKQLKEIEERLKQGLPTLCISTQLIEAGVDVDFASVIRFVAGLDSIAQAAGRCNRNGHGGTASVYVINPDTENVDMLADIKIGQQMTELVFNEFKGQDLLLPKVMSQYFNYYFYDRADEMGYLLCGNRYEFDTDLISLLGTNALHPSCNIPLPLKQSFMSAGKAFKAIDAPTESIIVPYEKGEQIITDLCALSRAFDPVLYREKLKEAQQYSVNVFPNAWRKLVDVEAIQELGEGEGVYYLKKEFYSPDFGLCDEVVASAGFNFC
jgi:CRISPR-associated endonuclease/helicase Cas3